MANIKSQKKRNRTNELRRQRNVAIKSRMKTMIKKALEAGKSADPEAREAALRSALSAIDRACTKGAIHRNTAARKKSLLCRRLQAAAGTSTT